MAMVILWMHYINQIVDKKSNWYVGFRQTVCGLVIFYVIKKKFTLSPEKKNCDLNNNEIVQFSYLSFSFRSRNLKELMKNQRRHL